MSSTIQLRRRWSSCRHGRNNRHQCLHQQPWTISTTTTTDDNHEEMVLMKYGLPALLSLMALKYQQGIQSSTPFETCPWLMSISIFGMLLYFSSGNIILRLSIAADHDASSAGYSNIKIKDKMILMTKTLHTILGFSVVAILASLLCHPHQHSSSSSSSWSLLYMIFIFLSALIIPTYYSSIVSCFHWLHHTILAALFHRLIQRSPNKEASATSVEQAIVHDDVESLPV